MAMRRQAPQTPRRVRSMRALYAFTPVSSRMLDGNWHKCLPAWGNACKKAATLRRFRWRVISIGYARGGRDAARFDLARTLGASATIDVDREDPVIRVRELTA